LRREGWRVIRIWEHQLDRDQSKCCALILEAIARGLPTSEKLGSVAALTRRDARQLCVKSKP
jgi:G:T-mismatch repair DNA endonuclease (very short patch repair protein)